MDVDLIGWVGVGLGGTSGHRCGILCAPMLGVVVYAGLVSLTSSYPSPCSPYSSEYSDITICSDTGYLLPFQKYYNFCYAFI